MTTGDRGLTKNLRGVGAGVSGSICLRDTVDRKSTIADVEVALWREACSSWTLGRSSDIRSITESRGSLPNGQ